MREYRSTLRGRQARETRRAVVDAAATLFARDGYAATTLDAVAGAAGVSRRTVVNTVGTKAALLAAAWDVSLVGDDAPEPMSQRPAVRRIEASTDPAESVRLWVDLMLDIGARAAPLIRVIAAAADADDEVAALAATVDRERWFGARAFAEHLARIGGLRDGVDVDAAADLCWAHNDGHLHRRLVVERGWAQDDFRSWLVGTVSAALLA